MEISVKNSKGKSWKIGPGRPVFIVAEIGKNFIQTKKDQPVSVYLANAKRLVAEAQKAGADAVKFQTHNFEDEQLNLKITSPHFKGADRYRWVKRNTLATPLAAFWKPLKQYCDRKGILFLSTPMSRGAARVLAKLPVTVWKVGSGDILDFVMLDFMAASGKPIILSSGMSSLNELSRSINFLKKRNCQIILLHAVSRYPCPPEQMNLRTMELYSRKFKLPVGFSQNSPWLDLPIAAAALGARVIEQHFTLDRGHWGSDHKISMLPSEFRRMVKGIREVEAKPTTWRQFLDQPLIKKALGQPTKVIQPGEKIFRPIFHKALVAARDIPAGAVLTADLLYAVRPQSQAGGLPSHEYERVLGRKLKKDLKKYEPITHLHFQ